jgi:membrane protease YdiL (CAAX protease family)
MHHHGGTIYVALSFIAGLFYGYAMMLTKRIEASIIVHFIVNLVHILMFTYPYAL